MKKYLAFAAIALLPTHGSATSFEKSLQSISGTVAEMKGVKAEDRISTLIEAVRIGTDRKTRIDAVKQLEELYATQAAMDKSRIVAALMSATEDNDGGFRHYAVAAVGHVAEQSDDFTVDGIARDLGQKIENAKMRTPFTENGERADLLIAYARTGGRAHVASGRHADQFIDGVLDEVRETDSRGKTLAFRSLNIFLERAMNRIYGEKRELFGKTAMNLIPLASDNDVTARSEYAKAMVTLNWSRRTVLIDDPSIRQKLHDRLEEMYNAEWDSTLKCYLGIHLGHRSIVR